jgi:hypothetical protein
MNRLKSLDIENAEVVEAVEIASNLYKAWRQYFDQENERR